MCMYPSDKPRGVSFRLAHPSLPHRRAPRRGAADIRRYKFAPMPQQHERCPPPSSSVLQAGAQLYNTLRAAARKPKKGATCEQRESDLKAAWDRPFPAECMLSARDVTAFFNSIGTSTLAPCPHTRPAQCHQ